MPLINHGNIAIYKSALRTVFPTTETLPEEYTEELIVSAPIGGYITHTVGTTGFYRVDIRGGGGQQQGGDKKAGGPGGATSQIIYLYKGQKCLLWAGATTTTSVAYPGTQTSEFGGRGASGRTSNEEGGGGGGGPAIAGSGPGYEAGTPGAGSGFLAGFDNKTVAEQSITAGSLTRSINYAKDTTAINFTSITTYIMAGGGGGGSADNGDSRAGGGGGGALGDGGDSYVPTTPATSGPAGTWGKGANGSRYSAGAAGAWAILDFSRNQTNWGTGGGAQGTNGQCTLYRLVY